MQADAARDQRAMANRVVTLLALAIFINALDRGNFSTAAPMIKGDLGLTNGEMGVLISAFFWTYVPGMAASGWLVERWGAYRVLAAGLAVWSLATILTGFAGGFVSLLVLRVVLGLSESCAFPASSKLLAMYIPPERLATANAWNGVGLMMGNGVGILLGGLLMAWLGWHALFFVFGGLSLLWLIPWLRIRQPEALPHADPDTPDTAPPFAEMLARREMWGAMLGHFFSNYAYFLVLSWLPLFLVRQHGYSIVTMAWLGGAVYVIASLSGLVFGKMADRLVAGGTDPGKVRRFFVQASMVVAVLCMLACATGVPELAIAGLLAYGLSNGLGYFSIMSIGQTLAGPRAAGKWMGLQNGFAGLAGMISPVVTGFSIDATGDYRIAFLIAAALAVAGMAAWGVIIPRIAPLAWKRPAAS
ncbi:MFS transporter [Novosphingobium aquae]|uniref:MFS transporter n=1 Tax=Novosphingobium aquae TaxID=3133435 RepID=A0ABU8SDG4_9SPHN